MSTLTLAPVDIAEWRFISAARTVAQPKGATRWGQKPGVIFVAFQLWQLHSTPLTIGPDCLSLVARRGLVDHKAILYPVGLHAFPSFPASAFVSARTRSASALPVIVSPPSLALWQEHGASPR